MDIIGILVVAEIIVSIILISWYILHVRRHLKQSPAEQALKKHLTELEAEKTVVASADSEIKEDPLIDKNNEGNKSLSEDAATKDFLQGDEDKES